LVVMRGFFFSGRLTIPYVGMEAVLLKDCQRGAMQGRRAADHVERGNPGWYGGTGRGRVLVLGWAALRACQDAGKAAYERNVTKGELGRNTAKVLEAICGWFCRERENQSQRQEVQHRGHAVMLPQSRCALKCAAANAPGIAGETRCYNGNRYDCGVMPLDSVHS
jgi:hypothetical protein